MWRQMDSLGSWLSGGILVATLGAGLAQQPRGFRKVDIQRLPPSVHESWNRCSLHYGALSCNGNLAELTAVAYNLPSQAQVFGPKPLTSDRYSIGALAPEDITMAEVRLLLQNLLRDQFGFRVHQEKRAPPILALTVLRAIRMIPPAASTEAPAWTAASLDRLEGRDQTMAALAEELQVFTHRAVRDETKLAGGYEIDLVWRDRSVLDRNDAFAMGGARFPTSKSVTVAQVRTALRAVGLDLVETQAPQDVVVVDRILLPTSKR